MYEYDGEFQDDYGEVMKGYFGFGAVLDAPHNPNAIVIPGMMARLGDLLFGVLMRAVEFNFQKG